MNTYNKEIPSPISLESRDEPVFVKQSKLTSSLIRATRALFFASILTASGVGLNAVNADGDEGESDSSGSGFCECDDSENDQIIKVEIKKD